MATAYWHGACVRIRASCQVLVYQRLESTRDPLVEGMKLKLVTNIARVLTGKLRQATLEIKLLRN